jgi:hypothetical protein
MVSKSREPYPAGGTGSVSAEFDWGENMSFPQSSFAFDNTLHSACISVRPGAERMTSDTGKALLTSFQMPLRASIRRRCYTSGPHG